MRCGDCKHWGGKHDRPEDEFRECTAILHGGVDSCSPNDNPALAITSDGSDYFSSLRSRADFGCVLFEAKGGAG